ALITAWPKLGEWLTTYRDDLRLLDGIRDAAAAWAAAPEAEQDNLLIHRGGRLEDALRLRDGGEYTLADPAPAYLAACVALREREAAEKEAQRRRELQQARDLARQKSKAATRLRLLAAILAVLALIAPVLWIRQAILRSQTRTPVVNMPATQIMVGSPPVAVHVPEFAIERYEVSNQQYDLCISAGVCASRAGPQSDEDSNVVDHPVVYVNAYQADAYCRWLDRRLPSSLEWERAARSDDHEPWLWDPDPPDPSRVNMSFQNADSNHTSPVNGYPTGSTTGDPEGVFNLVGNVWEWTASPSNGGLYGLNPQWKMPLRDWLNDDLILRGGSFIEYADQLNWVTHPSSAPPGQPDLNRGFRCVQD
ncbi:MAG: SUMF1/EgtB/PvdO family nonheme iron enzyme, partial [Anaerolineae bacterium]